MSIPILYWIWVTDPKLIQAMKESKLSQTEAMELCGKYAGNKKKYFKRMMIYASILLIAIVIVLVGKDFLPNEGYVFIPLLIAIFVGAFGGIFSFNKYNVSNEYVKALQIGYPNIV